MYDFDAATAVRAAGDGRWSADIASGWDIGGRANGGYTLAIAARAGLAATGRQDPLAVSGHFLRPPEFGPVDITTRVLRAGQTVSTATVELAQGGAVFLSVLVSGGTLPTTAAPYHLSGGPPDLPPPQDCTPTVAELPNGRRIALAEKVAGRIDPRCLTGVDGKPSGRPVMRGWQRFADGRPVDPLALVLLGDALPPTTFGLGLWGWVPTVQMTVYVRARPQPVDGWVATSMASRLVDGGWLEEDAEVWDATGRLVGQTRQFAGVRLPG